MNNGRITYRCLIDAIEYSQDLLNAGQISANSARNPDTEIEAYFARLNMTIADNFYLNASVRREGSTKLGADNRWGTFPAVGLGADLNSFLGLEGVQQLKARASYGVTGNLPGGYGLSQEIRGWSWGGDGAAGGSTGLLRAANPNLKWEEKAELNFGIDLTMDRFSATLDIYQQTSKDFIINRIVDAAVYGFDRRFENAGQLSSDGVELALNYDVTDNYTTSINGYTDCVNPCRQIRYRLSIICQSYRSLVINRITIAVIRIRRTNRYRTIR